MRIHIAVVTYTMVIDGYHLSHVIVGKHTKGVVYRRLAQCRDVVAHGLINFVNVWMIGMFNQIIQYGKTLQGRSDAMLRCKGNVIFMNNKECFVLFTELMFFHRMIDDMYGD